MVPLPSSLSARVRFLFHLFLQVVIGLMLLVAVSSGEATALRTFVVIVALLGLSALGLAHYRRRMRGNVSDALAAAGLVAVGWGKGGVGPDEIYGLMFVLMFVRTLDPSRRRSAQNAVLILAAHDVVLWATRGLAGLTSSDSLANHAALAFGAVLMHNLAKVLRHEERSTQQGAVLTRAGRALGAARTRHEVKLAALEAARELVLIDGAADVLAAIWDCDTGEIRTVSASTAPNTVDRGLVPAAALPDDVIDALNAGLPFQLSDQMLETVHDGLGEPIIFRSILCGPMLHEGRLTGSLSLASRGVLTEGLQAPLGHLSVEVGLALGRARLAEGLARSESLFRGVVQSSPDLIAIVSPDRSLRYLSPSIRPMLGLDPEALLGRAVVDMLHPEDGRLLSQMLDVIEAGKALPDALECRVRHRDGSWCHVEVTANRIAAARGDAGADQGRPEGFAMSIRDVTRRKEMEAEITFRAFHDSLTQLANRTLFTDRIERAVARSQPGRTQVAVAFIDLDDFKEVNDSFGHSVGDELLVTVAGRLRSCLRNVDTAARLGGDEFALLLEDVANPEEALAIVRRAMEVLRRPFRLGGRDVSVRASVGVALGSREQFTPDELLRNADVAMYAAKAGGKGRYEVFDPATHDGSGRRLELRIDLQGGIDRREFFLVFEPIALLASERIAGMEALVRWNHPQRGLMTPEEFIPLAEESGLIVPLGRWIIDEACHQAKGWYDDRDGIQPPFVAINLSARQLHDPELIHDLEASLDRSGLPPACVTLEVTESVLMHDVDDTLRTLRALKALGVRLAIDDFGTGYSSFSYLRRFPVDILKVDRAFIENLQNGPEDSAVARAIVKLAQTLKLQTVAEGISNPEQLQLLRDWGCEFGQGYHFSRPMSPQAVQRVLRDRTGAAALAAATASSVFAAQRSAVPAGAEL